MKHLRSTIVAAAVLSLAVSLPALRADPWDQLTYLTVKEAIRVPGAQLPPGKYAVRLLDSQSNRNIVQFFSEDRSKLLATVLAIPTQQQDPVEDTQLRFYETRGNEAPALRSWFYPGDTIGREFVYPKSESSQIARNAGRAVPSMDDETGKGFMTHDAKATPKWKEGNRVYTWGPKDSEMSDSEATAMTRELDSRPDWRERQTQYRRMYTWEDPRTGVKGVGTSTTTHTTRTSTQTTSGSQQTQASGSTSANTPMPTNLTAQREDIQSVVQAIEAHSDAFEKDFQNAIKSSTVRIEDREALVRMVDDLEDSFDKLKSNYSNNNMTEAHRNLHKALEVASRVNSYMTGVDFKTTEASWSQVRQDLNTLAQAHGYALLENWGRGNASR